jgi:hypothetical protein
LNTETVAKTLSNLPRSHVTKQKEHGRAIKVKSAQRLRSAAQVPRCGDGVCEPFVVQSGYSSLCLARVRFLVG